MKRIVGLLLITLPFIFAGCASVAPTAPSARDVAAKQFTTDPNSASLYIYRAESIGAAVGIDVDVNGKTIGKTSNNSYFQLNLAPGDYVIDSHAKNSEGLLLTNDSSLPLTIEAGKIYFVKLEVGFGLFYASSDLQLVDPITGKAGVEESTIIEGSNAAVAAVKSNSSSTDSKTAKSKDTIVFGTSGVIVEKLAMKRNCQPVVGASLIASNGPMEDYVVKCADGNELGAHCEYHQCVLK